MGVQSSNWILFIFLDNLWSIKTSEKSRKRGVENRRHSGDIFKQMADKVISLRNLVAVTAARKECQIQLENKIPGFYVFVDEAQCLLTDCAGHFMSF